MKKLLVGILSAGLLFAAAEQRVTACTSILISKGASADSSVIILQTCDNVYHPRLEIIPASHNAPGDSLEITDRNNRVTGKVAQPEYTFKVIGQNTFGLMNEHQVAIRETTFGGRAELRNPDGLLTFCNVMTLALQRARTAREAIMVIDEVTAEYGYRDTGESFSIADKNEAWIMEMIGKGPGRTGIVWVACRVPDGAVSCHANRSRIGEFPLDDPDNCLFSEDVISFAVRQGYFDNKSGAPFRFHEAYDPITKEKRRRTDMRIWSILRRVAPSQSFDPGIHRGTRGNAEYPLWVIPDKKLSTADAFALVRDHYEGTAYDMTKGLDAGPFGSPDRCRPLAWEVEGVRYAWERPISTPNVVSTVVSQSRNGLPDAIGGLIWYGLGTPSATCFMPLYVGIEKIPDCLVNGSLDRFSWESAWWVFNFVATYATLKYSYMTEDIRDEQRDIEDDFFTMQPTVEHFAAQFANVRPRHMTEYLTNYSVMNAEMTLKRWRALGETLIGKYIMGYVIENGRVYARGYPETWLKEVIGKHPGKYRLPPE